MTDLFDNLLRYLIDFTGTLTDEYAKKLSAHGFTSSYLYEYDVKSNNFTETPQAIIADFCLHYYRVYKHTPTNAIIHNEIATQQNLTVFQKNELIKVVDTIGNYEANEKEFGFILDQIVEIYTANKALQIQQNGIQTLKDHGAKASIQKVQNELANLIQTTSLNESSFEKTKFLWNLMDEGYERIQSTGGIIGETTPYGFAEWDTMLGGMAKGELIVFSGPPSGGKSFTSAEIGYHNGLDCNKRVVMVNLELQEDQVLARLVSRQTGIPSNKIRHKKMSDSEKDLVLLVLDDLRARKENGMLFIPPIRATTISCIKQEIDYYYGNQNPDLIIIDYLDELARLLPGGKPLWERIDQTVHDIRTLAFHYNTPVITITQNNRRGWNNADAGTEEVAHASIVKVADTMFMLTAHPDLPELVTEEGPNYTKLNFINAKIIRSRNDEKNQVFTLSGDFARTKIQPVNDTFFNSLNSDYKQVAFK